MNDFKQIIVERSGDDLLVVSNQTQYPLVGQGRQGAVFRLSPKVCVKIYADESEAQVEGNAYKRFGDSSIIPKLYEVGKNYIVMEYIDGPSLKEYLLEKGKLSRVTAYRILSMFHEMKRLGITRMDESLRHILVPDEKTLKIVDHFHAYTFFTPYPDKFLFELQQIGMLKQFLRKASELDEDLYLYWKNGIPEYFTDI